MTYIDGEPVTMTQAKILTARPLRNSLVIYETSKGKAAHQLHERGWIEIDSDYKAYDKATQKYIRHVRYTLTGADETARAQLKGTP